MIFNEMDYLMRKEQRQDILRRAAQRQMLRDAGLLPVGQGAGHRQAMAWLGAQMIRWGIRLRRYGYRSSAVQRQRRRARLNLG